MDTPMFRKAAMDKVSSPEQLDLLMQVTSPMGWLVLATVGVILFATIVWSVVGAIPEQVASQGVLIRGERLIEVKAASGGDIADMKVTPGMDVEPGTVLAIINRDKAQVEEKLTLKKQEADRVRNTQYADASADQETIARNQSLAASKRQELKLVQDRKRNLAELVAKGLKPANVLIDADRQVLGIQSELNSLEKENAAIRARQGQRDNQLAGILAEVTQLQSQLQRTTTELASTAAGRVVEVIKVRGDKVQEGEPLVRLEPKEGIRSAGQSFCDNKIHAVMYVSGNEAGRVRVNQQAKVSPTDVKKEESGYMPGTVVWVSPHAASSQDMKEKLKNDTLVQTYTRSGAVHEIRVCLVPDTKSPSGFKWAGKGVDKKIDSGGMVTASMVVDRKKPISMVIPMVKKTFS